MAREYKQYVPQNISELMDHLGYMMLSSPRFEDSYFVERSIDTAFAALKEGIETARLRLGNERCAALHQLTDRMRAYFESDPDDQTGEAKKGRKILREMEDILKSRGAAGDK